MIKFFRKIRQQLLNDNAFSKYLLYAFGEIILVVIGILIALQINNYNNYKKQREIEQQYLLSLQSEFNTNLIKINDCISENDERLQAVEDLMILFNNDILDTTSNQSIADLMRIVFSGDATYIPARGVLTDIISSGNLNLIQNEGLRQNLASFESTLDFNKMQENATYNVKSDLHKLLNKYGSLRGLMKLVGFQLTQKSISDTVDIKTLFRSVEFENYLLDYYMTIRASSEPRYFGGLKDKIEDILLQIDAEIKE